MPPKGKEKAPPPSRMPSPPHRTRSKVRLVPARPKRKLVDVPPPDGVQIMKGYGYVASVDATESSEEERGDEGSATEHGQSPSPALGSEEALPLSSPFGSEYGPVSAPSALAPSIMTPSSTHTGQPGPSRPRKGTHWRPFSPVLSYFVLSAWLRISALFSSF
jgi:hypothetical protein